MSSVKWNPPPPGGPATRSPVKVVFEGVPPGSPLARTLYNSFQGRISRFYLGQARNQALGELGYTKTQQRDGPLWMQYANIQGQEIVRVTVEKQVQKDIERRVPTEIPWDWLLIDLVALGEAYTYNNGNVDYGQALGAAAMIVPQPDRYADEKGWVDYDSGDDPPILIYPLGGPYTYAGPAPGGGPTTSSLLVDIRRFPTSPVITVDIYARKASMQPDSGDPVIVGKYFAGAFRPAEASSIYLGSTSGPPASLLQAVGQSGLQGIKDWYGVSGDIEQAMSSQELFPSVGAFSQFFIPGGDAEVAAQDAAWRRAATGSASGFYLTNSSGEWIDDDQTAGWGSTGGKPSGDPNDDWPGRWGSDSIVTAPAPFGAEWGIGSVTRNLIGWYYLAGPAGGNPDRMFPVSPLPSKTHVAFVDRQTLYWLPTYQNESVPVDPPVTGQLQALAFRGTPEWGWSYGTGIGDNEYRRWEDTQMYPDRWTLPQLGDPVAIPSSSIVTEPNALTNAGYHKIGRVTFEQKYGSFAFAPV